jgi:hypothetical protein
MIGIGKALKKIARKEKPIASSNTDGGFWVPSHLVGTLLKINEYWAWERRHGANRRKRHQWTSFDRWEEEQGGKP